MSRLVRPAVAFALATAACLSGAPALAGPARLPGGVTQGDTSSLVPIVWEGQAWLAKMSPVLPAPPAPNYWLATPETVFTDSAGRLHLVAQKIATNYYSAAVTSVKNDYGYGNYRFVVDTKLTALDPMAVVGMFTYNPNVKPDHQEVDVELSRWGQPSLTAANAQFVVQPWRVRNQISRFYAPNSTALTYEFTWSPKSIVFKVRRGTAANAPVIRTWKTLPPPNPPGTGNKIHLNLWFARGQAPYNHTGQSVIFRSFSYTPAA